MDWRLATLLICAYGVIKEFRPATPFLTPYLENAPKNFTNVQLYSEIYPFSTYSYLLSMVPIFVLTDVLRYKPIVILEALGLTVTWALLLWGKSVFQMQLMQIAFGIASSSEIAYVSYIYAVVDKRYFQKITSYVRTAALIGKFCAFSAAQIIVTTSVGSYLLLNQISFAAVSLAFLISVVIPRAPKQILNGNQVTSVESLDHLNGSGNRSRNEIANASVEKSASMRDRARALRSAFGNRTVLTWSLWWALTSCGVYQVANYAQTLWAPMQNSGQFIGNGFVECSNTLLSAALTFSLQYYKSNWQHYGDKLFFVSSVLSALLLQGMARTENIFLSYAFYVLNSSIYHLLIAAASTIIASQLDSSNYGLVFGFNTFVALAFQTALTFVASDARGLALPIRTQFVVYSAFFAVIGLLFLVALLFGDYCFPKASQDSPRRREDQEVASPIEEEPNVAPPPADDSNQRELGSGR